jgi:hypothetical protein
MRISGILLLLIIMTLPVVAQNPYDAALIPKELLTDDLEMVIRTHEVQFEVASLEKTVKRVKVARTILKEEGDGWANVVIYYDQFREVDDLQVRLYDARGEQIKKFRRKDIHDISANQSSTFHGDGRIKYVEVKHYAYPFTVEYEYVLENSQTLTYPVMDWLPARKVALQQAALTITSPEYLPVRFKSVNIELEPQLRKQQGLISCHWSVKNLSAVDFEPFGPAAEAVLPYLITAPNAFQMDGYQGNMASWRQFGQWINQLNEGRDELPADLKQKVQEITAPFTDTKNKAKAIYEYLQQTTRYVSIQLGIGGLQPFEASFVAEKGYGDCKALTNYTKAMLKEAGIDSYYTLVNAGEDATPVLEDFPSNSFNHVFLCVPDGADTLWLECTSQTNPFGYLGSFTSDRNVLVINEQGGQLIRTPAYDQQVNTQFRTAEVSLQATGDAHIEVETLYKGLQYENAQALLHASEEEQKKMLYRDLSFSAAEIRSFKVSQQKRSLPQASVQMELQVRNLASKTGNRLFLRPNLFNTFTYVPRKLSDRKNEVILSYPYFDADTIVYRLPQNYSLETKIEPVLISNDFGEYLLIVKENQQQLTFIRQLKLNKQTYPKERYEDLREFMNTIRRKDLQKVVLVEKSSQNQQKATVQRN